MEIKQPKIKVFVFDLGGVIFADGRKVFEILKQEKGYEENLIKKIIKSDKRFSAMRGEIADEEFWQWAKNELPTDYDIDYIRQAYYESYLLDKEAMDLAVELKKRGYRMIIFSGNMRTRVDYLEKKYNFSKIFDHAVYSFNEGYSKPEPEFFEAMIRSLDCDPTKAVLIDDREFNIEYVKQKYGMHGAVYVEGQIKDVLCKLKKIGIEI